MIHIFTKKTKRKKEFCKFHWRIILQEIKLFWFGFFQIANNVYFCFIFFLQHYCSCYLHITNDFTNRYYKWRIKLFLFLYFSFFFFFFSYKNKFNLKYIKIISRSWAIWFRAIKAKTLESINQSIYYIILYYIISYIIYYILYYILYYIIYYIIYHIILYIILYIIYDIIYYIISYIILFISLYILATVNGNPISCYSPTNVSEEMK